MTDQTQTPRILDQGGWLIIHRDGWTQHTADEGTAIDLVLPLVGEYRPDAERMVRHYAHRNAAGPRVAVIDEDFAAAVRCGRAATAANVQRRVEVLDAFLRG